MGLLKPHKATNVELEKLRFPVITLPKLDGVRGCFLNSKFTSRTLKEFRNRKLTYDFGRPELQGFDGEIVVGNPLDQALCRRTTSFVNRFQENADISIEPTWYIFDWVTPETVHMPYSDRLTLAKEYIKRLGKPNIKLVPEIAMCKSMDELTNRYEEHIETGYEGIVIRSPQAYHKSGRSTVSEGGFLRMKPEGTEEATILDVIEAQANFNPKLANALGLTERSSHKDNKIGKGMIGSLLVQLDDGRKIVISAGCMTHEERTMYFQEQHKIRGRICTYRFMDYGEHNMRRHPRFVEFRDEDL